MKTEEVLNLYWYALDESCPLALLNWEGRITYVNQIFCNFTGYRMSEVHGFLIDLLHIGSHHLGFKDELVELISSGKTWKRKICINHRDGHAVCFEASFYPGPGAELLRQHLLVFLPESPMTLEEKEKKGVFLEKFSDMAHDLRNPLYNITALSSLLLDTSLDDRQLDFVKKMKGSAGLLQQMLDEMLLSCIKNKKEDKPVSQPFNIREAVKEIPALFSHKVDSENIVIRIETDDNLPKEVYGDNRQLSQLFMLIIHQLFQRPGLRSIRVSALMEDSDNKRHSISFFFFGQYALPAEPSDSQVEMNAEEHIPVSTEVKSKISLLNGQIFLTEENPKAFYLHFQLPFDIAPVLEDQAKPPQDPTSFAVFSADIRVLVAEDVELNQLVMKHQLQKIGVKADFVRTGFNVLEKLKDYTYDLIIMDVQMPGMDGLQATEAIRSDKTKPWHRIPIIGISASIGGNARDLCISAGANDFVTKPYELDDLKRKIYKLVLAYQQEKISNQEIIPKMNDSTARERFYDLSYLEEIGEGDQEFSATMISYFINNTPSAMEALKQKALKQDWPEVRQIAHKLKPQVIYMGIHHIEEDVEQIEYLAEHQERLEEIPALIDKTAQIIFLAIEQLKNELKKFS